MKKLIILALLSIFLLTLAACGGGSGGRIPTSQEAEADIESRLGSDIVGMRRINAVHNAEHVWSVIVFFDPPTSSDNFINVAAFVTSHVFDFFNENDLAFSLVKVTLVDDDRAILQSMSWIDLEGGVWSDYLTMGSRIIRLEELNQLAAEFS